MSKEQKKVASIKEFAKLKGIEDVATLEAVKAAEFHLEFQDQIVESINDATERQATKEELEKLGIEMKDSQSELRKALKGNIEEVRKLLRAKTSNDTEPKTFDIRKELKSKEENLRALSEGDRKADFSLNTDLVLKDMTFANNLTGEIPQAMRLEGVNEVKRRSVRLLDLISVGQMSAASSAVSWVYESDGVGNPSFIGEGVTKPYMELNFAVGSANVKKIAALVRVTDEMLNDIPWMERIIRKVMQEKLLLAVESQVYNGDGTGANLLGIRPVVPAFSSTGFAGTVDNANIVDVLNVAINQIMVAFQPMPTAILMHPSDLTRLKMFKVSGTDRRYVDTLTEIALMQSLGGIPIIPTTLVPQGEYLLGYFPYSELLQKGGVQIDIGYNGNDFSQNFKTVRVEWRGVHFIEHNDRPAFVRGVFATDQAALETV